MKPPARSGEAGDGRIVPRRETHDADALERYPYGYAGEAEGGPLIGYWRILMRRKGTVVLIGVIGGLAALLLTLPQTPIYQARTSLEIQIINPDFMNMRRINPVEQNANPWDNSDIQTQIKVLTSETLLERVVQKMQKFDPQKLSPDTGRPAAWRRALNLPAPQPQSAFEEALAMAAGSMTARADGNTRIVEILVDSSDPALAADFANTLAGEFIDYSLESRWRMSQRTGEWLGRQLEDMRIKLEKSEERLQDYARRSGLLFTGEQQSVAEEKLRQLQANLSAAQADRVAKQSRYEMVKTSPPEELPDVLNDDALRNYMSKLTDLRREDAELATTYTRDHSSRRRIHAQIDALEAALNKERSAILGRIRHEYEEAVRRESIISADYYQQTHLVTDQSARSVHYSILKRDVDSNRQLYETMLERVKEAAVASALHASNVRVVDAAKPPVSPYKPDVLRNCLLGLVLGGFAGVIFSIVRERMDSTIRAPGDIDLYLNVPELGTIPFAEPHRLRLVYRPSEGPQRALVVRPPGEKTLPNRIELAAWKRKPSLIADSFRAALTSILFAGQNDRRARILVLTSCYPQEGKSTVASNLAIAMAEVNRRVLLIDGDLRRPRQHEIYAVERSDGLSEILQQPGPLEDHSVNGSVRFTAVPNLFLLPSGAQSGDSTNLLYSERMEQLIRRFETEYDMVLIDTPPMLQIPDARILGRLSDAVILVLRAGRTTRDDSLAARQRFAEDGTRVLGTILNAYDLKRAAYGRYSYEGYYARRVRMCSSAGGDNFRGFTDDNRLHG